MPTKYPSSLLRNTLAAAITMSMASPLCGAYARLSRATPSRPRPAASAAATPSILLDCQPSSCNRGIEQPDDDCAQGPGVLFGPSADVHGRDPSLDRGCGSAWEPGGLPRDQMGTLGAVSRRVDIGVRRAQVLVDGERA